MRNKVKQYKMTEKNLAKNLKKERIHECKACLKGAF